MTYRGYRRYSVRYVPRPHGSHLLTMVDRVGMCLDCGVLAEHCLDQVCVDFVDLFAKPPHEYVIHSRVVAHEIAMLRKLMGWPDGGKMARVVPIDNV